MKKVVLIIFLLLITSCSTKDENPIIEENPPSSNEEIKENITSSEMLEEEKPNDNKEEIKNSNEEETITENKEITEELKLLFSQSKYYIESNLQRYVNYGIEDIERTITYVNSNRDYEYYTNIKETDISKGFLLISNKYYKLPSGYKSSNLVKVDSRYANNSSSYLDNEAYTYFQKMIEDAELNGLNIRIQSAYRSYDRQNTIYNNYVKQHGKSWADHWSARPGHSEHQTGLAADVAVKGSSYSPFGNSKEYEWLKDNCYKYGLILRYPAGKEDITGYGFEPWHYRYVGDEVATYIYQNKITYEEYYAYFLANK